jgi:hypothetical protein
MPILRIAADLIAATFIALLPAAAQAQIAPTPNLQSCAGLRAEAQRLQCAERLLGSGRSQPASPPLNGGWRLSRTADPQTGRTSVAVMHTADPADSDVGFAGLMFRCGSAGLETLLVVLEPIPPSVKPVVTVRQKSAETNVKAQVLELGTLVLLPDVTTAMASQWSALPEISFQIDTGRIKVGGTVPTGGLSGALQALRAGCPMQ